MALDRDFIDAVRDLDEHELRRLLILATAHLERSGALPPGVRADVKLRQQRIRCGKPNCTRCPHGPYWYAYWREAGRRKSRYVGKLLEEE
ncbi:MAG: hypothetical protein OEX97_02755 [Acidimicrobiia bacterium]|nr:hypothetical protein [Acidimicrobiia bacterium]